MGPSGPTNLQISGDAPGIVADYVEQKIGAPMLFINGAEGNMAPIYSVYPTPAAGHLGEFRRLLGDRILQANERVAGMTTDVVLTESETIVETPLRPGLTWPSELGKYIRTLPDDKKLVQFPSVSCRLTGTPCLWGAPARIVLRVRD